MTCYQVSPSFWDRLITTTSHSSFPAPLTRRPQTAGQALPLTFIHGRAHSFQTSALTSKGWTALRHALPMNLVRHKKMRKRNSRPCWCWHALIRPMRVREGNCALLYSAHHCRHTVYMSREVRFPNAVYRQSVTSRWNIQVHNSLAEVSPVAAAAAEDYVSVFFDQSVTLWHNHVSGS